VPITLNFLHYDLPIKIFPKRSRFMLDNHFKKKAINEILIFFYKNEIILKYKQKIYV